MDKEKLADKMFEDTIDECVKLRQERKKIYHNSWFTQENSCDSNFYGGIINKTNRLKILHLNRLQTNSIEKYEDCLKDLIILTLFTLVCHKDELHQLKNQKRIRDYDK